MNRKALALAIALLVSMSALGFYHVQTSAGNPTSLGGANSGSTTNTSRITGPSSSTSTTQATTAVSGQSADWVTYHHDNSRDGYTVSNLTSISPKWNSSQLDGQVYAEPLVFERAVFVVTENNSVYSLNASNGSINWRINLGAPVPRAALVCGNIDPTGITGTPVIDPVSRLIYVVTFLNPTHHVLFAIGIDDPRIRFNRSADPVGMDPSIHQQRGALTLANGYVYVPYGGLIGDCGPYHGWVAGIPSDGSGAMISYQVPTGREGGLWAPSGPAVGPSGNLYFATGNGDSSTSFDHGDSVVQLTPDLRELDFFAPTNWASLNEQDTDLGSTGPAFVGAGMLFQIGKQGVGYLLNASSLGGIGGQLFSLPVCGSSFGGVAYSAPLVFVPCTDGLTVLRVTDSTFAVAWRVRDFSAGPPIVTGHIVWTVDLGSGVIHAFSAENGTSLFSLNIGSPAHFTTPSYGDGYVFVAASDHIYAFGQA